MDQQSSIVEFEAVTSAEEPKTEEIRAEMAGTRAALADKLGALQENVQSKVTAAQTTVEQTVAKVQDTVQAAKRAVDIKYQTEQRPWCMFGTAVAAGALVGYFLPKPVRRDTVQPGSYTVPANVWAAEPVRAVEPRPVEPPKPSLFTEEWNKVKGLALGVGMAMARDWLKEAMPAMGHQIQDLMDNATRKLGSEPMESPFAGKKPS